jgi:hypothetical protein
MGLWRDRNEDKQTNKQSGEWTYRQIDGQQDGQMGEQTYRETDKCAFIWTDRWTDRQTYIFTYDGQTDGLTHRRMDSHTYGQIDRQLNNFSCLKKFKNLTALKLNKTFIFFS